MTPCFETERLILRPVTERDIPAYERHFVDYEVIRYLAARVPWPYPESGVRDYVMNSLIPRQGNDYWGWGIFEKEASDQLIGHVDLWRNGRPENRGFWLGRPFWGRGYMTEAVAPIMGYTFEQLEFEALIFSNAVANERSRRIKIKTGAQLIERRPFQFVDPSMTECEIFRLTRDEWRRFRVTNGIGVSWLALSAMSNEGVNIRPMVAEDADAIHRIHYACLTRTLSANYSSDQIAAWMKGRSPSGYVKAAAAGERFFVAESDGRIVGFASWEDDELLALFVDPDTQRAGIGSRLLQVCFEDAASHGSVITCLKAAIGAEPFYARRGFIPVAQGSTTKHGVVIEDTRMVVERAPNIQFKAD